MKYYVESGVHTLECKVSEFAISLENKQKKNLGVSTYMNAGFFGVYHENGTAFTLPAGHLVADYNSQSTWVKKYCAERGKFIGNKFYFDSSTWSYANQFYKKTLSCLIVEDGKARIEKIYSLKDSYQYVVSGVPIIVDGKDASYVNDVQAQGYDSSTLYATKHIFIGLKSGSDKIYVLGYKTTTGNMVRTSEMYKILAPLGYTDVIKLDGGGSYHFVVENSVKDTTSENRRDNSFIIITGEIEKGEEPTTSTNEPDDWAKEAYEKLVATGAINAGGDPKEEVVAQRLAKILDNLKLLD